MEEAITLLKRNAHRLSSLLAFVDRKENTEKLGCNKRKCRRALITNPEIWQTEKPVRYGSD